MELNTIKHKGTWAKAANDINTNFAKLKIGVEELQDGTIHNKGYYTSVEALTNAFPTAQRGAKAYVGSTYPYEIYLWDYDNMLWVNSGEVGGDENVNLEDYFTKEESQTRERELYDSLTNEISESIEGVRDDYDNVMTQEAYDAIEVKEDKFYFIYEEE